LLVFAAPLDVQEAAHRCEASCGGRLAEGAVCLASQVTSRRLIDLAP
jgi:hypothetical protein